MKKLILLVITSSFMLAGCDSIRHKVGEEVRQVEIGDSLVSDGTNEVVYQQESDTALLDMENNDPILSVNLIDVDSGQTFKVGLGSECARFPLPKGERLLARFDKEASKAKPNDIYMGPQSEPIITMFCS